MVGFTSGAFAGSVAQANYAAAKGGIVSPGPVGGGRAAPLRRHRQCDRAGRPHPDVGQCPAELSEMGEAEDVAPMVVYLLSDRARHVTGQVYTVVGSKIAVWNQPAEVRAI